MLDMRKLSKSNIKYWIDEGYSLEESEKLSKNEKRSNCKWCKEYWQKRGFSENESVLKVKETQSINSSKRDMSKVKNVYVKETWIDKGYSIIDAENKVKELKEKCNIYENMSKVDLMKIMESRKSTYYSKTKEERVKINKSRGRTKPQLIEKFGEEYVEKLSKNRGSGRRNSTFCRYSKVSEKFFDILQSLTNNKLEYSVNEKWIRYNKNKGYYVDLIVSGTKKIIEFNGDFYHANPELYESDSLINISKEKILVASDIWDKDVERLSKLKEMGYDVMVIWEKDVKENKENVINECISFIGK